MVPLRIADNNCMMNEIIKEDLKDKVDEMINDFYWNFRDDVNDEGGQKLIMIMQ